MNTDSVLDAMQNAIDAGEDVLQPAIGLAQTARENMDTGRWLIGDLALLVQKQYGKNTIQAFADGISIPVARVREYRTTAGFYDRQNSARTEYLAEFPTLTYTHFRQAMRLKDLDAALSFLLECTERAWKSEAAALELKARLGKPTPPAKLLDVEGTITSANQFTGVVTLVVDKGAVSFGNLRIGEPISIKLYEVKAA